MSNLKHLSVDQLEQKKQETEREIGRFQGKINGLQTRLTWINKYIEDKQALVFAGVFNGEDLHVTPEVKAVIDHLQGTIACLEGDVPF